MPGVLRHGMEDENVMKLWNANRHLQHDSSSRGTIHKDVASFHPCAMESPPAQILAFLSSFFPALELLQRRCVRRRGCHDDCNGCYYRSCWRREWMYRKVAPLKCTIGFCEAHLFLQSFIRFVFSLVPATCMLASLQWSRLLHKGFQCHHLLEAPPANEKRLTFHDALITWKQKVR